MKIIVTEKKCQDCRQWKVDKDFYKSKTSSDGLYSYCKDCKDKKRKAYREKNLEKEKLTLKKNNKKWYQENKEKKNRQSSEWIKNHRDKARGYVRKSRIKYSKEISQRRKEYRKLNLQKLKDAYKKWSSANPDKEAERTRNRRARVKGVGGKITNQEWQALKKSYGYACLCCGAKESEIKLTLDHVLPIIRGGKNIIENAQPLCQSCNSTKGTRTIDYR